MALNSKLLANPAVARLVRVLPLMALAVAMATPPAVAQEPTTAERETALKAFTKRVDDYVALKKKLSDGLDKPKTGDVATAKVQRHQDTLASRLMTARRDAKPGDVFGEAAPLLKQTIKKDTETRGMADAYAAMEEVPAKSPPAVNSLYPEKAALATVPPLILVNLPRLPDGLEYRFMGRDLILRDREANLIVDFIPGAVPAIKR
jgi:hypothetical protein